VRFTMEKIQFKVGDYYVREVSQDDSDIIEAAKKLRYKVFCRDLKWVDASEDGKEYDRYDKYAVFFTVLSRTNEIIAFSRILPSNPYGFMFQNEFRELLDRKNIENIDFAKIAEISRLTKDPDFSFAKGEEHKVTDYLFKIMYKWSTVHKKRYWLFCTTEEYLKHLDKSLPIPIHIMGPSKEYQKGVKAWLAMIDLKEAERAVVLKILKNPLTGALSFFRFFKSK